MGETTSTWRVSHVETHHVLVEATPPIASEFVYIERILAGSNATQGNFVGLSASKMFVSVTACSKGNIAVD